jgi:N-methylhydantoinase A
LFSAFGMTVADQQYDYQRPVEQDLDRLDDAGLFAQFAELLAQGEAELRRLDVDPESARVVRLADCRYAGQPDVMTVETQAHADGLRQSLASSFEAAHQRQWNFVSADKPIVVANLRLQVVTQTGWRGGARSAAAPTAESKPASNTTRAVYFDGAVHTLPVYQRGALAAGTRIEGPAVIEEHSSCSVLKAAQNAVVDEALNLVIELAA